MKIWIDIVTPADVSLFNQVIKDNSQHDYIITARVGDGYTELIELLDFYGIKYYTIGRFGKTKFDKLIAHADRIKELAYFIADFDIDLAINLINPDQTRVAFGLGIPVYSINDMPYINNKLTPQAKLTYSIADKFIVPFYSKFETPYKFNFLLQQLWLVDDKDIPMFDEKSNIIVFRDEEYNASYYTFDNNIDFFTEIYKVFKHEFIYYYIPRYKDKKYDFAITLKKAQDIRPLLKRAKFVIGGGGTINIEALYYNCTVISFRRFKTEYDQFLQQSIFYTRNVNEMIDIIANDKRLPNILHNIAVNKTELYKLLDLQ